MSRLDGKIALITGGSSGMGLGITRALLDQGASVGILFHDAGELAGAAADLQAGDRVITCQANVTVDAQMQAACQAVANAFGGLDILVNSAGIQRYGTVTDTPEQVWDEVMAVNLKGIFLAARHAIPLIAARGGGAVINIASVQAYASQQNVAAYTASKGAILALTRAMALDHAAQKVRVNAICPASIDTPMLRWAADIWKGEGTAAETLDAWGRAHPNGRVGRVDEIGAIAAFLASDDCGFVTGADIKVDGGVLAKLGILLPE